MAALQAEHFLASREQLPDRVPERAIAEDDAETAKVLALQTHVLSSFRIVSTKSLSHNTEIHSPRQSLGFTVLGTLKADAVVAIKTRADPSKVFSSHNCNLDLRLAGGGSHGDVWHGGSGNQWRERCRQGSTASCAGLTSTDRYPCSLLQLSEFACGM